MLSLLIETSTERGLIAILKDQTVLFNGILPFGYQNSKHLLPQVKEGIIQLGLKIGDFDYIAVGAGPGSYTGIRVGASAAKALAFAGNLPLIGICTLEVFTPLADGKFAVVIDAKIGGVYLTVREKRGEEYREIVSPQILGLDQLEPLLPARIITPNQALIKPKLEHLYPEKRGEWIEQAPDPQLMNRIALKKFHQNAFSLDGSLPLLYMRKTQAEIEHQNNSKSHKS